MHVSFLWRNSSENLSRKINFN